MSSWTDSESLFTATTVTGGAPNVISTVVDFERALDTFAIATLGENSVGGQVALNFYLQGSLDGSNFYNLTSVSYISDGSGNANISNGMPARYIRVVISAGIWAGSTPTVDVTVSMTAKVSG